jgi:hypothetical protein
MKRIFSFLLLALFLSNAYAQNPNLGTSGAKFLNIAADARSAAMGGAVVGLTDDVNSVFWNPAGIAHLERSAASFSYMRWFDMFDYNAAAVSFNVEGWGTFAASVAVFTMDKMEITTETDPNGTGRYYDAQDMAIGLSYARFLTDRFCVGITAKIVNQRIWNENASGVAFDVGTQYRLDFQNLTIAMKMSNFGADLQYDGEDLNVTYDNSSDLPLNRLTPARLVTDPYPLPLTFQVGIGFDIFTTEFMKAKGAIDAVHPNDNKERVNTGIEFSFFDRLFLRGGYRFKYDQESFTLGAGANIPLAGTFFNFDYAFAKYDVLPSVHRITVGIEF